MPKDSKYSTSVAFITVIANLGFWMANGGAKSQNCEHWFCNNGKSIYECKKYGNHPTRR